MLQDAKIQNAYFSLLPIAIFAEIWYNVSENNSRGDTMKFVFLIGNGFDLNLNLKTRYRNFYDRYISLPSKNSTIKKSVSSGLTLTETGTALKLHLQATCTECLTQQYAVQALISWHASTAKRIS